jgi:hypothetical protein
LVFSNLMTKVQVQLKIVHNDRNGREVLRMGP